MGAKAASHCRLIAAVAALLLAVTIGSAAPAFATTGGLIVFGSDRDHAFGGFDLYTMDGSGSSVMRLTFDATGSVDYSSPDWSFDAKKIAFLKNARVWVMDANGSNPKQLTTAAGADFRPSWSPDGTKIAYEHRSGQPAVSQIMVMDANGSNPHALTNTPSRDNVSPSWSPDGTKIAFASTRGDGGIGQIYVMGSNGSNQVPLTTSTSAPGDSSPAWSPDGKEIAFDGTVITGQTFAGHIFVMNANGTSQHQITNGAGNGEGGPTWSPDGTRIAFEAAYPMGNMFSPGQIYAVNSDGTGAVTNLTNNSFQNGVAAWQKNAVLGVSGHVTDAKGNGVQGVPVKITGTDSKANPVNLTVMTDSSGLYTANPGPGTYKADVTGADPPAPQPKGGRWVTDICPGTSSTPGTCQLAPTQLPATVDFGYLLPDLQGDGIEVSQGIQREQWQTPAQVSVPGLGAVFGGTYTGVPLVRDVPIIVRVYASVARDREAQDQPDATAILHAYRGGVELAGSPLSAKGRKLQPLPALPAARTDNYGSYWFNPPMSSTEGGPVTLVSEINPEVGSGGNRAVTECLHCTDNNATVLSGIGFKATQPVTIRPFEITYRYPRFGGRGFITETGPNLSSLFDRVRDVLPVSKDGLVLEPYPAAVLDISAAVAKVVHFWRAHNHIKLFKPNLSDCMARPLCRDDIEEFELDAITRDLALAHGGHTFLYGFEPIPDGVTWTQKGVSIVGPETPPRPLTGVAHELLHLLGFEHASAACGGGANGQVGVSWPPDQLGYIHGIGLDRFPYSDGGHSIIAPGLFSDQWYDFMSYCTGGHDSSAWISTDNWTKYVNELGAASDARAARDKHRSPGRPVAGEAAAPRLTIDAAITPGGGASVLGAGATTDSLSVSKSSPFHLKVLGTGGGVIHDVGVTPQQVRESAVQMLVATVPASAGAQTLELTVGGHPVSELRRPRPGPNVRLVLPRRGLKAVGHKLTVRWRARGARGVTLTVAIQYLKSARQGWQTLAAGLAGQSYAVPVSRFAHARRVRIRVVVNDGFSTAIATSGLVKLPRS